MWETELTHAKQLVNHDLKVEHLSQEFASLQVKLKQYKSPHPSPWANSADERDPEWKIPTWGWTSSTSSPRTVNTCLSRLILGVKLEPGSNGPPRRMAFTSSSHYSGMPSPRDDSDHLWFSQAWTLPAEWACQLGPMPPKMATYDGKLEWILFGFQFARMADKYGWDDDQQLDKLIECLCDKALKFFSTHPVSIQGSFRLLITSMDAHF